MADKVNDKMEAYKQDKLEEQEKPNLGWVRMCEPLRFKDAKVLSVTISRGADDWYG